MVCPATTTTTTTTTTTIQNMTTATIQDINHIIVLHFDGRVANIF